MHVIIRKKRIQVRSEHVSWFRSCKQVTIVMLCLGFICGGSISSILVHMEMERMLRIYADSTIGQIQPTTSVTSNLHHASTSSLPSKHVINTTQVKRGTRKLSTTSAVASTTSYIVTTTTPKLMPGTTEFEMEMSTGEEQILPQLGCNYKFLNVSVSFCYYPSNEKLNYTASKDACVGMGLSLLVLDGFREYAYVARNIVQSDSEGYRVAAWQHALGTETNLYWDSYGNDDNKKIVIPRFRSSLFPQKYARGNHFLCITLQKKQRYRFTLEKCDVKRKYICKDKDWMNSTNVL